MLPQSLCQNNNKINRQKTIATRLFSSRSLDRSEIVHLNEVSEIPVVQSNRS